MKTSESIYSKRALYLCNDGVSINQRKEKAGAKKLPPVQAMVFFSERNKAFDPATPTSIIYLDA